MLLLSLLLAAAQVSPSGGTPASDPYAVEDPFATEAPAAVPTPSAAPTPTSAEQSSERLICRSRPQLGSRTRWVRNCLTAEQWEHHATNMEQQRRDINDMGAAGCDMRYAKDC